MRVGKTKEFNCTGCGAKIKEKDLIPCIHCDDGINTLFLNDCKHCKGSSTMDLPYVCLPCINEPKKFNQRTVALPGSMS